MKKLSIIIMAALLVVSSLVTGVFAVYTNTADVTGGSVVAKNFVITGEDTQEFGTDVKIAPTEKAEATFTVSNFDSTRTTEVDMDVEIEITLTSTITPLTIKLVDAENEETVCIAAFTGSEAGVTGTSYSTSFAKNAQTTKSYKVIVEWPSSDNDIDFEGTGAASYTVSVTGTQNTNA